MALKTEHELHERRRGKNLGVLLLLLALVGMIFWLTVIKVQQLGDMGLRERMDPPATTLPDPDYQPRPEVTR